MSKEIRIAFLFVIVIFLTIQTTLVNARDNSAFLLESSEGKQPDFFVSKNDNFLRLEGIDRSAIDAAIETIKCFPLEVISSNGLHLKRPGTAIVTIESSIQGYQVYVDDAFIDTEGLTEPLDGQITIRVDGDLNHNIRIVKGGYSRDVTKYFEMDKSYTINL